MIFYLFIGRPNYIILDLFTFCAPQSNKIWRCLYLINFMTGVILPNDERQMEGTSIYFFAKGNNQHDDDEADDDT